MTKPADWQHKDKKDPRRLELSRNEHAGDDMRRDACPLRRVSEERIQATGKIPRSLKIKRSKVAPLPFPFPFLFLPLPKMEEVSQFLEIQEVLRVPS